MVDTNAEVITKLESVRAKRNTALTIIESSDIFKTLIQIKRRVSAIKHQSKRGQLLKIVAMLENEISKSGKSLGVFCIAEKINGDIYYKYIDVKPDKSEYHYDDVFHVFKIQQILFDLEKASQKEIDDLIRRVNLEQKRSHDKFKDTISAQYHDHDNYKNRHFINNEINQNIDQIKTIYFIYYEKKPTIIPVEWLNKNIKLIIDYQFDAKCPIREYLAVAI